MENVKCKIACGRGCGEKGSALLIVLGMFAFMLVSAVAFSVYMRASRAPSSYLRRNTSVRQVVKAAVARAIDEVDTAIGNDPFPGIGYNHDYGGNGIQQGNKYKNDNWHGRVFVPSNEVAMVDTVSTLTLEGLGYLPPCLVNEVRYWSRHTRTARWHAFNYGLGRYAFTAVNVSDFFDLNNFVTPAGGGRHHYLNRSSSPHGRVSPTYLFRTGNDSAMNGGGGAASTFLSAMATGSGIGNTPPVAEIPFVSLMDFNISLLNNPIGGLAAPFSKLIKDNNGGTFLSGLEDAARRTVFMAGGWNGGSNLTYAAHKTLRRINLRYPEWQPFYGLDWVRDGSATLEKCYETGTDFWRLIEPEVPVLSIALMCDYLDCDSVPVSLCIPSVEAVPMLCGVALNPECVKYRVNYAEGEPEVVDPNTGKKQRIDTCTIHVEINELETLISTVYPFASGSQGRGSDFAVESFARVFFVEDSTRADGDLDDSGLRNAFFDLGANFTWSSVNDSDSPAFMQVKFANGTVKSSDYLQSGQGETLERAAVKGDLGAGKSRSRDAVIAKLTMVDADGSGNWKLDHAEDPGEIDFYNEALDARVDFKAAFEGTPGTARYRPCVAVWMRIKDNGTGKTVDMAPAIPAYDNDNGFAGNKDVNEFNRCAGGTAGAPAIRFFPKVQAEVDAGIQPNVDYFKNNNGTDRLSQWKQTAYAVNDPRYNWAPEQWYAQASGNPKDFWFDNVKSFRDGHDWCDTDIFMSVSDQGYLQSMYEFMMLPMTDSMVTKSGPEWGAFEQNTVGEYNGKVRLSANDVAYNKLMWRTYRAEAFRKESDGTWSSDLGYLERMPFDEPDNGLRVNPYTDITNVMFGAFANMPLDWAGAGTNWNNNGMINKDYMKPESGDFKGTDDYIFDWSYKYQDVYAMASFWMGLFRRTAEPTEREELYGADAWQDVFDDYKVVYWRTGEVREEPPGVDVNRVEQILKDEMTSVDRKFLYGYLRGCFANTAQLFLVFVRAETTAGGAVGAGARAVALVWRDPAPPMDGSGNFVKATGGSENPQRGADNAQLYLHPPSVSDPEDSWRFRTRKYPPHRTRILFYHQFD